MSNTVTDWAAQLSRPDRAERLAAASALRAAGKDASLAAVSLVCAVTDEDESVRTQVAEALENLGPPPAKLLGALAELLSDPHSDRAYWAATLLGRAGEGASSAVPALAACVGSANRPLPVRERAVWALGKLGPAAAAARVPLEAAAREPSPRLARLAADTLAKLS